MGEPRFAPGRTFPRDVEGSSPYFLRGPDGPWYLVPKEVYVAAERAAGFTSKFGPGEAATASWSTSRFDLPWVEGCCDGIEPLVWTWHREYVLEGPGAGEVPSRGGPPPDSDTDATPDRREAGMTPLLWVLLVLLIVLVLLGAFTLKLLLIVALAVAVVMALVYFSGRRVR